MPSGLVGGGLSAPDAAESRIYRQYLRAGRHPTRVFLGLLIAWLVVGAGVAMQVTIPSIGRVGTILVRLAIWFIPLVVLSIPTMAGPRGPFRDWWWPRLIVRVDDRGLAWWMEGAVRRPEDTLAWSAIATIRPTLPSRTRPPGSDCALTGADGRIVAWLPCRLVRIDRPASRRWRRVAWLPDVAVAVRPDRYQRRRVLGRAATLRDPASEATG